MEVHRGSFLMGNVEFTVLSSHIFYTNNTKEEISCMCHNVFETAKMVFVWTGRSYYAFEYHDKEELVKTTDGFRMFTAEFQFRINADKSRSIVVRSRSSSELKVYPQRDLLVNVFYFTDDSGETYYFVDKDGKIFIYPHGKAQLLYVEVLPFHTTVNGQFASKEKKVIEFTDVAILRDGKSFERDDLTKMVFQERADSFTDSWVYIWTEEFYHCLLRKTAIELTARADNKNKFVIRGLDFEFGVDKSGKANVIFNGTAYILTQLTGGVSFFEDKTNHFWYCINLVDGTLLAIEHVRSTDTLILLYPDPSRFVPCPGADVGCGWTGLPSIVQKHESSCQFIALRAVLASIKLEMRQQNALMEKKLEVQVNVNNDQEKRLIAVESKSQQQQIIIDNQKKIIADLEALLNEQKKSIVTLQTSNEQQVVQISETKKLVISLQTKVEQSVIQISDQQKLNVAQQTQIDEQRKRIADLEAQLIATRKQIDDLTKQLADIKPQLIAYIDSQVKSITVDLRSYIDTQIKSVQIDLRAYVDAKVGPIQADLRAYIEKLVNSVKTELRNYIDSSVSVQIKNELVSYFDNRISKEIQELTIQINSTVGKAVKVEIDERFRNIQAQIDGLIEKSNAFKELHAKLVSYIDGKVSAIKADLSKWVIEYIDNSKIFQQIKNELTTTIENKFANLQVSIDNKVKSLYKEVIVYIDTQIAPNLKIQLDAHIDTHITEHLKEMQSQLFLIIETKMSNIQNQVTSYIDSRVISIQKQLIEYIDNSPSFKLIEANLSKVIDSRFIKLQADLNSQIETTVIKVVNVQLPIHIDPKVNEVKLQLITVIETKFSELVLSLDPKIMKAILSVINTAEYILELKTKLFALIRESEVVKEIKSHIIAEIDSRIKAAEVNVNGRVDNRINQELKQQLIIYIDNKILQETQPSLIKVIDVKIQEVQSQVFNYIELKVLPNMQKWVDNSQVWVTLRKDMSLLINSKAKEIQGDLSISIDNRFSQIQNQLVSHIDSQLTNIQKQCSAYLDARLAAIEKQLIGLIENSDALKKMQANLVAMIESKSAIIQQNVINYVNTTLSADLKKQLIVYIDGKSQDIKSELIIYIDKTAIVDLRKQLDSFIKSTIEQQIQLFLSNSKFLAEIKVQLDKYLAQAEVIINLKKEMTVYVDNSIANIKTDVTNKVTKDVMNQVITHITSKVYPDLLAQVTVTIENEVFKLMKKFLDNSSFFNDLKVDVVNILDSKVVNIQASLVKYIDSKVPTIIQQQLVELLATWKAFIDLQALFVIHDTRIGRLEVTSSQIRHQSERIVTELTELNRGISIRIGVGTYQLLSEISFERTTVGFIRPYEGGRIILAKDGTLTGQLQWRENVSIKRPQQTTDLKGTWDATQATFSFTILIGGVSRSYTYTGRFFDGPALDGTFKQTDGAETGRFHLEFMMQLTDAIVSILGEWSRTWESSVIVGGSIAIAGGPVMIPGGSPIVSGGGSSSSSTVVTGGGSSSITTGGGSSGSSTVVTGGGSSSITTGGSSSSSSTVTSGSTTVTRIVSGGSSQTVTKGGL